MFREMSRAKFAAFVALCSALTLTASAQSAPQSARQALLEMFSGKTPGGFEKHLPEATRKALKEAPPGSGGSMLQGIALLSGQFNTTGVQLQTFESGPTLLAVDDPRNHSRFEVTIERDDLHGDVDGLELSFHGYKNGEPQTAGVIPKLSFTMKQETGVWRLEEIALTVGVSLSSPDFLKTLTTTMRPAAGGIQTSANDTSTNMGTISSSNEATVASALRTLNVAEITYAAAYPQHGFTCSIADLGGMGSGGEATEQHAMLITPRLASGRSNGYVFAISGCNASPASRYALAAIPAVPGVGVRALCSDESGVVRYSLDGKAASCLSAGKPLQ